MVKKIPVSDSAHVKIALRDACDRVSKRKGVPVADLAHAVNAAARATKSQVVPMRDSTAKKRTAFLRDEVAPVLFKLQGMDWEERMWFLNAISESFCVHCGDTGGTDRCYCRRDD